MRHLKTGILFAIGISINAYSQQSLPLCAFLNRLEIEAEKNFEVLRGTFDFNLTQYEGTLSTPDFSTCVTSVEDGTKSYSCRRRMPDNAAASHAAWDTVAKQAKMCFTGRTSMLRHSEQSLNFKTKPHGAEVRVSYLRTKQRDSATYLVIIKVSASDPE